MLLRSKIRRSRLTVFLVCLVVLTAIVYTLLIILSEMRSVKTKQQQLVERRGTASDDDETTAISGSSSIKGRSKISIGSVKLTRKIGLPIPDTDHQSTDDSTTDAAVQRGNVTMDDDDTADTGMERAADTAASANRQGEAERHVMREVARLRLRRPKQVRYSAGQWQLVHTTRQVYVYSAFYDDRPDIEWKQVRIIAVAESDVHLYELCCLLWYRTQRRPHVAEISIAAVGPQISPFGQSVLEQFIFSCRLDANSTDPPISVSLVSPHNFRLSNLLPVQVPERPKQQIEFGLCMSVLYWQTNALRLVEWLEAHRMWGVGEVNVYTTKIDNITDSVLDQYAQTGFVRHRSSPGPLGDDTEYAILVSMSPVINDCMYRNMYRYKYVVCTDMDEMIVPASPHRNYSQMIDAATATATRANAIVHSYLFRNTYFFLDFGAVYEEPWYLLTARYTKRVPSSRYGYSSKSVTRPLSCVGLQNHLCWQKLPSYNGQPNWNVDVPTDIGKSHHYKKCHFDKFLHKYGVCHRLMTSSEVATDQVMLRFRDELAIAVANKLLELDLVEITDHEGDRWNQFASRGP